MKRIGDLDVDSFYRAIDFWGERITEGFKRIENTKESIWAINPKARGWFYGVLLFCGIAVSLVTIFAKWEGWNWNGILDVFNDVGIGIFSSVVVVWFLFQSTDWASTRVKSTRIKITTKIMGWGDPYREKLKESGREEARREEQERQSRFEESLRNQNVSQEIIRNARKFSGSSSKDR